MSQGQLLLLDAGGVLVPETLDTLFERVELDSGGKVKQAELLLRHQETRHQLWSGAKTETEFWQELQELSGVEDGVVLEWREDWKTWIEPLDTIQHLEGWRKSCQLGLLSNHLSSWLKPSLKKANVLRHFKYLWISSDTGQVKPDPDAFLAPSMLGLDILYVDDKEENLLASKEHGFQTVLADSEGDWVAQVNSWID